MLSLSELKQKLLSDWGAALDRVITAAAVHHLMVDTLNINCCSV